MLDLKWILALMIVLLGIVAPRPSFAQQSGNDDRVANLKLAIENVLKETRTPGAGVAIVTQNGPLLIGGFGKADVENNVNSDERTLFRIASISKMFVALSILKLEEEGRLRLDDKVRDLVPDVEFENPWEETDPVRIVHLLEHTTGWDDYHLVEQIDTPLTLKQGLDFHPHSRRSRWIPGSRMAYSNSGSGVAAYIVEKITGQQYEDYVKVNFFRPLKMEHSTFFKDDGYETFGATPYDEQLKPLDYRHVIQRPAGAIHSSALEMSNFVRFLLNRGTFDSLQIVSKESIARMEMAQSTPGAKAGLQLGYGLANFTSVHNEFVYQGHDGGMPGARSELAYLPEYDIGHVILINQPNGLAFSRISKLIRDFETETIVRDSIAMPDYASDFSFESGYYLPVNPRIQGGYFFDRLFDIFEFKKVGKHLEKSWFLPSGKTVYYPVSDSQFMADRSRKIGLVKAVDPLEGELLYTDSRVYESIPSFVVFSQITIVALWVLMMGVGGLIWVISLASKWAGKSRDALKITLHPMMATFMFFSASFLLTFSQRHHSDLLTSPGLLSISLLAVSVWFLVSAVWSVVIIYRLRKVKIGRITFWSMAILSTLHLTVAIYLLWFDVIPIVTWS